MITSELAQLIRQELDDLRRIVDSFSGNNPIHELEIELCLRKTRNLYDELNLLKEQIRKSPEPYKSTKEHLPVDPLRPTNAPDPQTPETSSMVQPPAEKVLSEPVSTIQVTDPPFAVDETKNNLQDEPKKRIQADTTTPQEFSHQFHAPLETTQVTGRSDSKKTELNQPIQKTEPVRNTDKEIAAEKVKEEEKVIPVPKTTRKRVADEIGTDKKLLFDNLVERTRDSDLVTRYKTTPIADLTKAIPLNDRIWFTKELFSGDGEELHSTLVKLNQMNDLDDALHYLSDQFDWDADNKVVQKFLQIITRKFN
jgi:hypothetical protein